MEGKFGNKNFYDVWKNAIKGIIKAFATQPNLRIQLIIAIIVVILAKLLKVSEIEFLFMIIAIALILIAEMVNTAIEFTVDLVTEEYNEKAKIAKDVAAGAVVIAVINAAIIGVVVFYDEVVNLLN